MHRVLLPFEFAEPTTVAEAVELIDGDSARALAGGVDLVLKMRLRQIVPDSVVSLQKLPGLDYVRVESDPRREKPRAGAAADAAADAAAGALSATPVASGATLHIGALASLWQVERSAAVRAGWPLLAEAVGSIASVQTKVQGTLVGNLCVGTPASDVAPALYALGARVRIAGANGDREIPVEEFFVDAGRTALGAHEIVTEIAVPAASARSTAAFLKLATTSEDIAKVNAAVLVVLEDGRCADARIAVGSAAPTPVRARAAEQALAGRLLDPQSIVQAADAAAAAVCPISDVRSTARYREEMVRVLVSDGLLTAGARAAGKEA